MMIGETGFSDSGPSSIHHHHKISYALFPEINHPRTTTFSNQQVVVGRDYEFGELEQAFVPQGLQFNNNDEPKAAAAASSLFGGRSAATLEMFPPWPIRSLGNSNSGEESSDSGSALNVFSSKGEAQLEADSPIRITKLPFGEEEEHQHEEMLDNSSSHTVRTRNLQLQRPEKTLRRLAQNREAARKSRLRKKAYVQQLESSRIKLSQLEHDLQRARSQGMFLGVCGANANVSSAAVLFDLEYARWLEDDHGHMSKLRNGLQAQFSDGDLTVMVDACICHYDEIFHLKGITAKSDVFHIFTGMWITPAERCFLWMGGFRPFDLIKMLISQLEPLTEQQLMAIYSLQHSSQQAEEALSQGLEQLQQSVIESIAGGCITDDFEHMNLALAKLINLEGFIRQADNLRQQTLHQLCRILTVRQAAKCFVVIGEYYGRLRALNTLWASRPRENWISDDNSCQTTATMAAASVAVDFQMAQSSHTHFPSY